MFVHINEERRRVPCGLVADICPMCDAATGMEVARHESRLRVMFVPLKWSVRHHEAKCPGCSQAYKIKPNDFATLEPGPTGSFEELVARTNPGLVARLEHRAELQRRLASGKATQDVREEAILRVFRDASRGVERTGIAALFMLWLCLLIFAPMAGAAAAAALVPQPSAPPAAPGRPYVHPQPSGLHDALFFLVLGLASLVFIWLAFWILGRIKVYQRRRVYGAIAQRLAPLAPTREELLNAAYLLRGEKSPLAQHVPAARLAGLIHRRIRTSPHFPASAAPGAPFRAGSTL